MSKKFCTYCGRNTLVEGHDATTYHSDCYDRADALDAENQYMTNYTEEYEIFDPETGVNINIDNS